MEAEVARVAARLRGIHAEKLYEWTDKEEENGEARRYARKSRVFAPFHTRKRGLSVASTPQEIDWKALLHTVFRRYAGELYVQGRLLNQDELLVHRTVRQSARQQPQTETTVDNMVIVLPQDGVKVIVRCDDAPASRIGSVMSAAVVSKHLRALATSLVVSYRAEEAVEAVWKDKKEQELVTMDRVFGFDVAAFRALRNPRQRTGRSEDERHSQGEEWDDEHDDRDCANATIVSDWTFSDLRGVSRMMEADSLETTQWATLLSTDKDRRVIDVSDAWSFVSLGNSQKRVWSEERTARGDALRAKARWKDALTEYSSAIRLDDANADALVKRGQVFLELRQYEDAIRDFESVQQIDPTDEEGIRGLLRAKGKLGHSKHVVKAVSTRRSRSRSREQKREPTYQGRRQDHPMELVADSQIQEDAYSLEKERLRQLLEEEERQRKLCRKAHRKRDRSADSGDTTDSDAESKHSRRKSRKSHKKTKKSKKSDRKKHRSRDDGKGERRRRRSRSAVSSSSSSGSEDDSRHRKRKHRTRSRSRSRSRTRSRSHHTS